MKPYVAEILERNGRTFILPMPAKLRELSDCVHTLALKTEADEETMKLIGYNTLYVPEPELTDPRGYVDCTASRLSRLTEAQVMAIGDVCSAFELPFDGIPGILNYIQSYLEAHDEN